MIEKEPGDPSWLWDDAPSHWLTCEICGEWCAYSPDGVWRDGQDCLCDCGDVLRVSTRGEILIERRKKQ